MDKRVSLVFINSTKKKVTFKEDENGKWKIRYWKPNLFQKIMYRIGLMKDPRYNGKKTKPFITDEFGQMPCASYKYRP